MKQLANQNTLFLSLVMAIFLASCVTINVYFPASAAQQAATEIVKDVLKEDKIIDEKNQSFLNSHSNTSLALQLIDFIIPPAHAKSQANLFIDTPKIRSIRAQLKSQHQQIKSYFQKGNIGFTDQGLIQARTQNGLSIKQKSTLKKQLRQTNATLMQLYAEIALANNHPEWKAEIQQTFAKTWIKQMASGWMYLQNGQWLKK